MNVMIDRFFLIFFSFLYFPFIKDDSLFVTGLLVTIIYSFGEEYLHTKNMGEILCWIYIPVILLFPVLLYFYPTASYICFKQKQYPAVIISIMIGIQYFIKNNGNYFSFFIMLFGIFLSAYLCFNTYHLTNLSKRFIYTVDTDREQQLKLSEQNHILMKKQDYEIYTATLKERNRIAREIHDNVGHLLSRSILLTGALKTINKNPSLEVPLNHLDQSLNSAMNSIRSSVHDLHDESVNLSDSIHDLVNSFDFCPIELKYDMGNNIPKDVKYAFISITKEALTNIIKHSNADKVSVLLREQPVLYQLKIKDNGTCISFSDKGIGLSNMKERISLLHGNIQITPDDGFQIFITIPKEND